MYDSDEEPPLLVEDHDEIQVEDNVEDSSLMDEMLKASEQAKQEKNREQDATKNRKSFGSGLRKGFFQQKAPAKKPSSSTLEQKRESKLHIIKDSNVKESKAYDQGFVFPEVQKAMSDMHQMDPKTWMNDRFMEKVAKNSKLARAVQNPRFVRAMEEMQRDPKGATQKYKDDKEVSSMLQTFMQFMGDHFEELGKKQEKEESKQKPKEDNQLTTTPAIVDMDAKRREALEAMPRSKEEDAHVRKILEHPELMAALSDTRLMDQLKACQASPANLQRLAADPDLGPKFRLLLQHKLVSFA